jgi:hypothetical protein
MDLFPSAERRAAGQVDTHFTKGMYNNMVHLATNILSKDASNKATCN